MSGVLMQLAFGCRGDDHTTQPTGRGLGRATKQLPAAARAKPNSALKLDQKQRGVRPARSQPLARPGLPADQPATPAGSSESGAQQGQRATRRPSVARNYPAELRSAIGDPSGCLPRTVGAGLPQQIVLRLQVHVTSSGRVTRAHASSSVPSETLRCIRRKLESVRFKAPVARAPRTITTTITLERSAGTQATTVR